MSGSLPRFLCCTTVAYILQRHGHGAWTWPSCICSAHLKASWPDDASVLTHLTLNVAQQSQPLAIIASAMIALSAMTPGEVEFLARPGFVSPALRAACTIRCIVIAASYVSVAVGDWQQA